MDQATELRNYVAKHGKAEQEMTDGLHDAVMAEAPKNHGGIALFKSLERLDLEFNVTSIGFDMYEVMQMSDDALKLIWDLHERKWH